MSKNLRAEHRRLVAQLERLPFLPYGHPAAAKRRELRRKINRRLIEIEETLPRFPVTADQFTGRKKASELFVLMLQGKATTREYVDAVEREVKARRKKRGPRG